VSESVRAFSSLQVIVTPERTSMPPISRRYHRRLPARLFLGLTAREWKHLLTVCLGELWNIYVQLLLNCVQVYAMM